MATSIHKAAEVGDIDLVARLLDQGVDPNERSSTGLTPLHWAACRDHRELCRFLVSRGAEPSAESPLGTPSAVARVNNHRSCADLVAKLKPNQPMTSRPRSMSQRFANLVGPNSSPTSSPTSSPMSSPTSSPTLSLKVSKRSSRKARRSKKASGKQSLSDSESDSELRNVHQVYAVNPMFDDSSLVITKSKSKDNGKDKNKSKR